ncbi:P-loop containing nucleoside triphosphate hydrolase protein [Flagelloscypha sp. PMI_526]|nr:P-loop containing nucleoside triphosphate hydrolase protein [Flagelloscypha sp. PMI_526]
MSTTTSHKQHKEINCLVLGDRGIGLTSLLQRITTGQYWDIYEPEVTIEDAWRYQTVHCSGDLSCEFGSNRRKSKLETRNVPPTRSSSCFASPSWIMPVSKVLQNSGILTFKPKSSLHRVVLVGTKSDLRTSDEALEDLRLRHQGIIQDSQGVALANEMEALGYFPCSAKTGQGIEQLKELVVREGRANTKTIH